jgi:hypothetical protein
MKDPLYHAIESHWREYRPKMVKRLEASGKLESAIEYAADRTAAAESSLIQQGVSPWQAQQQMREEWAFLPSEADVPDLLNGGPEAWLRRATSSLLSQVTRNGASGRTERSSDRHPDQR